MLPQLLIKVLIRIFDEMAKLGEIDFENEGIDEPIDTVEDLCENMTVQ